MTKRSRTMFRGKETLSTSLLTTKLTIPPARPSSLRRPRLVQRLDLALESQLALISAPAGFGKTTLLSDWIRQIKPSVAWVSLDASDNDPTRFWSYFVGALQTLQPGLGENVLGLLKSAQPPPAETFMTMLINAVAAIPHDFVLVLDDYHVIDAPPIQRALDFLLDHLPTHMHLVLVTRSDPPIPLARRRASGQLTELRVADLRFTREEVAAFLNERMHLGLSAENITALETRTEGWVAGLQLAALAMQALLSKQGPEEIHGFIHAFTGNQRYIMDYLVEEVLARQPENVQSFLLSTSILDRLTGYFVQAKGIDKTLIIKEEGAKMPANIGGLTFRNRDDLSLIEKDLENFVVKNL